MGDARREEQQIAALREEIRRAALSLRVARFRVVEVVVAACGIAYLLMPVICYGRPGPPWWVRHLQLIAICVGPVFCFTIAVGTALALGHRQVRRLALRRRLQRLSEEERAAALHAGFRSGVTAQLWPDGDARRLAEWLARYVQLPSEITPAAAPGARGDEASPAEMP
jgi:hypothetical protein